MALHSPFLMEVLKQVVATDRELDLVGCAITGASALAEALRAEPDVVVLDFCLKECDGLLTARAIKCRRPATQVVMLCDQDCKEYVQAAREAGASACIPKTMAFASLAQMIKSAARAENGWWNGQRDHSRHPPCLAAWPIPG